MCVITNDNVCDKEIRNDRMGLPGRSALRHCVVRYTVVRKEISSEMVFVLQAIMPGVAGRNVLGSSR